MKENPTYFNRADFFSLRSRPTFKVYLTQLWERRHFIRAEARSTAFKNSKEMLLGRAWLVLQPILDICIYAFIFGVILRTSRNIDNFLGYLTIGVIFFALISKPLNSATTLIKSAKGMISSFAFPKAALAFSLIYRQMIDGLIPALVALALAFAFQWPKYPTLTLLLIVPLYFLLHIFVLGGVLIIARLTAFIPDLKALVAVLTRGLFFTSGIFFSIERFDGSPVVQTIMELNPAFVFLQVARRVSIYQSVPSLSEIGYLLVWSMGLLALGLVYFWSAEEKYINVK